MPEELLPTRLLLAKVIVLAFHEAEAQNWGRLYETTKRIQERVIECDQTTNYCRVFEEIQIRQNKQLCVK